LVVETEPSHNQRAPKTENMLPKNKTRFNPKKPGNGPPPPPKKMSVRLRYNRIDTVRMTGYLYDEIGADFDDF
jgi:hypothetical protein